MASQTPSKMLYQSSSFLRLCRRHKTEYRTTVVVVVVCLYHSSAKRRKREQGERYEVMDGEWEAERERERQMWPKDIQYGLK
jgi:hypothetical protein